MFYYCSSIRRRKERLAMQQISLFDEPTIARHKNRFEISDGMKYLGYIEMDKPKNGTVVFDFKYCVGRAYGGADEVPIKDMQKYVKHTAAHFLKLYRYRKTVGEPTVWREML